MIVRMAGVADVAALAELQDIPADGLPAFAGWVAAHAETHLPFVAEADGYVVAAAWLLVAARPVTVGSRLYRVPVVPSVSLQGRGRRPMCRDMPRFTHLSFPQAHPHDRIVPVVPPEGRITRRQEQSVPQLGEDAAPWPRSDT